MISNRWLVVLLSMAVVSGGEVSASMPWSMQHPVTGEIARVVLPAPTPAESDDSLSQEKGSRRIGYFRLLPKPLRSREVASGSRPVWTRLNDGRSLLVWMIESPQAMGIRAELLFAQIPSGAQVVAYDPAFPEKVSGPYGAKDIQADGRLWTETVFAEQLVIEMVVPARASAADLDVRLERIVHVYDFPNPLEKAGTCHGDPNCYTEWTETAKAIAAIASINNEGFIFCTGTLVTDGAPVSFKNDYFLTANHCITGAGEANTLEFYWFYNTPYCNGPAPNPKDVPRTGGGADYLVGATYSQLSDFTFLRLRQPPPSNAFRAPWSTTPLNAGESVTVIHHPDGSHKRISFGNINTANAGYWKVRWSLGATEGGSSGSPLFNAAKRIVGQLYGGYSSCNFRTGIDDFGRFDQSFTRINEWLNPPLRDRYVLPYKRDYNGDGKADMDLFWPEGGMWFVGDTTSNILTQGWGWIETKPVPADYDGDGKTDLAVYHQAAGVWYIQESETKKLRQSPWGWSEALPAQGDYDGDGLADVAVYHPAAGMWYIQQSSDKKLRQVQWGWSQAIPMPADYDGDGKTDIAVYHPETATWYIRQSSNNVSRQQQWGWIEVVPTPADFDGDGKVDIACYHRATGTWYIRNSSASLVLNRTWGWSEALPVPADYDGDGKADLAVYWPREGRWYISQTGLLPQALRQFGWSRAWPATSLR